MNRTLPTWLAVIAAIVFLADTGFGGRHYRQNRIDHAGRKHLDQHPARILPVRLRKKPGERWNFVSTRAEFQETRRMCSERCGPTRCMQAVFSGVGLGVLLPEIRILESPLLFSDYSELDHVKEALFDRFARGFEKKGYVLLGFAEAGFVYFFFQGRPLCSPALWEN